MRIETLKTEAARLKSVIKNCSDSLIIIEKEIKLLQNQSLASNFIDQKESGNIMIAVCNSGGILRSESRAMSEEVGRLNKNDTVILSKYSDGYWLIKKGDLTGYISELFITENEDIKYFKEKNEKKNQEIKRQLELRNQEDYRKKIIARFGKINGEKLLDGYYWVGMTDEMAIISLGPPNNKNNSVGSWGTHEQWVYDDLYLYFENGKLESYQNNK